MPKERTQDRPVQYFTEEYLQQCAQLTTGQILEFLENYRNLMAGASSRSKLISIKIPESLLSAFRIKSELEGSAYQTKIKELMSAWVTR